MASSCTYANGKYQVIIYIYFYYSVNRNAQTHTFDIETLPISHSCRVHIDRRWHFSTLYRYILLYFRLSKYYSDFLQTKDENLIRLAFSTPNSKTDRAFGVDINLNKAQGTFDAGITSPWKKGDFRGTLNFFR